MKRKLIGLVVLLCTGLLHAQVYDLRDFLLRRQKGKDIIQLKDGMYIKDQSGVLLPFMGTWSGVYRDYGYIISIGKGLLRGNRVAYRADQLVFAYEVYQRDKVGGWQLIEASYNSEASYPFIRSRYYVDPSRYSTLYLGKETEKRRGLIMFKVMPDGALEFYLMNNPSYFEDLKEEDQVFPLWDKEAGITNVSYLYRIGEPGALLLERPRNYDKSLYDWGVLSPMLKMQKDALFMLEGKSYVPLLDIRLLNKLRYDAGRGLPAVYDGYPKARYGYATLLDGEGGEGELGERNLAYGLHYMSDVMGLKGAREEAIHALNFKQLLHVAMLEHLARELLSDAEVSAMLDAERELYEYDFPHVLKVYAQKRGISLEELKRHCLADAERLFTAQRLPSISKAKQELKTLLDRGY